MLRMQLWLHHFTGCWEYRRPQREPTDDGAQIVGALCPICGLGHGEGRVCPWTEPTDERTREALAQFEDGAIKDFAEALHEASARMTPPASGRGACSWCDARGWKKISGHPRTWAHRDDCPLTSGQGEPECRCPVPLTAGGDWHNRSNPTCPRNQAERR